MPNDISISYEIGSNYEFGGRNELIEKIKSIFPTYETTFETKLKMNDQSLKNYYDGTEKMTARFAPGKIRIPMSQTVELIHTPDNDDEDPEYLGNIHIPKITIKSFSNVTSKEAYLDGKQTPKGLFLEMKGIYQPIYNINMSKDDIIVLWYFE